MPDLAPDPNHPQDHSQSDQGPSESAARKPWVKPAASVESVREVTAATAVGVLSDGSRCMS
jgi:hypothetical protein